MRQTVIYMILLSKQKQIVVNFTWWPFYYFFYQLHNTKAED